MRVWDSELLTQKGELQPVTDGLLFWLDGRDELYGDSAYSGESPTLYKTAHMFERVNGIRVNFKDSNNLGVRSDSPFVQIKYKTGGTYDGIYFRFATAISGVVTVEFVLNKPTSTNVNEGVVSTAGSIFYPHAKGYNCAELKGTSAITGKPVHIVCTRVLPYTATIFQNGVVASTTRGAQTSVETFTTSFQSVMAEHTLGCLRLYNRALSADEIAQNLAYEVSIGRVVL